MATLLPISPPSASSIAGTVDGVFAIELLCSAFVVLLVAGLIVFFSIRYRRRSAQDSPPRIGTHYGLEVLWTGATFLLFSGFFFMGAFVYVRMKKPPLSAQPVYVVGKQWMWKIQHADGLRELNQLHVPVGQPTQLIMTSEDVIHDFFIPAFRVKQDVLPGSYSSEWFTATVPGVYHLFCSQYCGMNHASMVGEVIVLTQADYDAWRAGIGPVTPPAEAGRKIFADYGCISCHGQNAPSLAGLFMSQVRLQDGTSVLADENYLRRSILDPNAQIVAGYPAIMPTYRGQLTPEQINSLVEYIKLLGTTATVATASAPTTEPTDDHSLPRRLSDLPPAESRPEAFPAQTKVHQ